MVKTRMLKIIALILNVVSLCVWVISVSRRIFVVMQEAVDKNIASRKQPQLAQNCKENRLLFRNRKFLFSNFLSNSFLGYLIIFMANELKFLRSYKLVWGGGKSP